MTPVLEGVVGDPFFLDRSRLRRHLAGRIVRGEACLFLGAGISRVANSPLFVDLANGLRAKYGLPVISKDADLSAAVDPVLEKIREEVRKFPNLSDKQRDFRVQMLYASDIRSLLYFDSVAYDSALNTSDELESIYSLCVSQGNSQMSQIVTFNLDCLLEDYFRNHGMATESVCDLPKPRRSDIVQIYHPHGLISRDGSNWSRNFVLAGDEYTLRAGSSITDHRLWRSKIQSVCMEQQPIFIGLSAGKDDYTPPLVEVKEAVQGGSYRCYVGFWLFAFEPNKSEIDRVRNRFGCLPVIFQNPDEMWQFVRSIRHHL